MGNGRYEAPDFEIEGRPKRVLRLASPDEGSDTVVQYVEPRESENANCPGGSEKDFDATDELRTCLDSYQLLL